MTIRPLRVGFHEFGATEVIVGAVVLPSV